MHIFDIAREIEAKILKFSIKGGVITNISFHLRSCGCTLLVIHFEGLIVKNWMQKNSDVMSVLEDLGLEWDVEYLNPFPGTDIVNKVSFRKFCPHCLKNFMIDKTLGISSLIVVNKIENGSKS